MAIWFTADTHFGHSNILKYCQRPFHSIQEHDETLVKNWNASVAKRDTVYHLGDFAFRNALYIPQLLSQLNGNIFLLRGNHDKVIKGELVSRFVEVRDVYLFSGQLLNKPIRLFLSHYAHRSWPSSFHGVGHLFGHSHGRLPPLGLSFDVGVDSWGYFPVSLVQVAQKLEDIMNQGESNLD